MTEATLLLVVLGAFGLSILAFVLIGLLAYVAEDPEFANKQILRPEERKAWDEYTKQCEKNHFKEAMRFSDD